LVTGPQFAMINEDSRAQLLVNGGTLGDDRIIQPYIKLYEQYSDSFYLQLCVLKGLGCTKTKKGFEAFAKLLTAKPPLVGEETAIADIFSVLADSIQLCRDFFPQMLGLCRYEEYRNPVYGLLATMVNAQLVTGERYTASRRQILEDADLALKRYNPSVRPPGTDGQFEHLEKTARELAENIKGSLDGLANNNFYRGSNYLKNLEASARHPLVNYSYILSPFYKSDAEVRDFFIKLSKLRTQSIAMPVAIDLLKQNVVLNDTLIPYYSRNKFTRAFFYSELEKAKLGERFDKRYLTQHSLIESVLSSQKQLYAYYNPEYDKRTKDSLVLVKEIPAKNKYQNGTLYIYRISKRPDDEQWSVVFVEGKDNKVNARIEVVSPGYTVNKSKSEQENIDDLLGSFYLSYRKRSLMTERYE
jgi:hypothetical protein